MTADGRTYAVRRPEFMAQSPTRRYLIHVTDDGPDVVLAADQITTLEGTNADAA